VYAKVKAFGKTKTIVRTESYSQREKALPI